MKSPAGCASARLRRGRSHAMPSRKQSACTFNNHPLLPGESILAIEGVGSLSWRLVCGNLRSPLSSRGADGRLSRLLAQLVDLSPSRSEPRPRGRTLLLFTQTFPPDPAAVGQHFGDAARGLARRGHRVIVYTSRAGYDDPSVVYPRRELTADGVEIRRLRLSSLGKATMLRRVTAAAAFMTQSLWAAITTRRLGGILFSTSPPLIGLMACAAAFVRRVPVTYWAMDLNPDQMIALGKLKAKGPAARLLEAAHQYIVRRSTLIVALDSMMAERIRARGSVSHEIVVIPPWSPDEHIEPVSRTANAFRRAHGLDRTFVVMYSGNHTVSNPLTTLLNAAAAMRSTAAVRFLFVGGGAGKSEVETFARAHGLSNILSLPYQPRNGLAESLSAADLHVVSLGDGMAGIIHPCKIYGAMAVGRPILYFGPSPSHVTELLQRYDIGWRVAHGDVTGAVATIRRAAAMTPEELADVESRARNAVQRSFSAVRLCELFCDEVEKHLGTAGGRA